MLSQETIQAVQQAALIEEVVGDFVTLKKRGQNLWACCPFHHEKTPSFAVSPAKGFYKCFGCDASGDAISFVKNIEGISFVEAVKYLAHKYGIPIEETEEGYQDIAAQNEKDSLYILMKLAQDYYADILWQHPEGKRIAQTYLQERGITTELQHQFGLGYSLDSWHAFQEYAQQQGYTDDLLQKAGLLVHSQDKVYDRFRGRIIFPIHNVSGKVIAFAARILGHADDQPKYINSPETIIYHKGEVVYGLYQAKQKIKEQDICFLVEGYTDVIALHKAGIENVVASSGTALTEKQIQLIGRFTKHITILFDGDMAGVKAALRGIDKILEQGLHVKVILLPEGEDPDSYLTKVGSIAFQEYIHNHAQDFITFKINLLLQGIGEDMFRKGEVTKEILQSIVLIPDAVYRSLSLHQASKLLDVKEAILLSEHDKLLVKHEKERKRFAKRVPSASLQLTAKDGTIEPFSWTTAIEAYEKESIRMLLNYGSTLLEDGIPLSTYLLQELSDVTFQHPVYKAILQIYQEHHLEDKPLDVNYFIQHRDEHIQKVAIDLTVSPYEVSEQWQEKHQIPITKEADDLYHTAYKNILRLKIRLLHQLIEENDKMLKENTDPEEEEKLLHVHDTLKKAETAIAQQLGMVIIR